MKFSKIYTEWVGYLKKRGIYGQYMLEYARVNEYVTSRELYIRYHTFDSNRVTSHKFLNSRDLLIEKKSDENMTFKELVNGIEKLQWNMFFFSKYNWRVILEDFGAEFGYCNPPKKDNSLWGFFEDDDYTFSAADVANSRSIVRATNADRYRGREEANIGQWYDVYYRDNNRNRNRFINNVRWRR